ncbi:MAG TPA: hypothetical protein VI322_05115 [Candidatus Saccharimonadia bacterium]
MKLKTIVGFSLMAFMASFSILLVVGLVLTHQTSSSVAPQTVAEEPTGGNAAANGKTYCGGKQPCYGKSQVAAHATAANCWGYNLDWVLNLTGYAPVHPNGPQYVANDLFCGKDVHGALTGAVAIGYKHEHQAVTQDNGMGSILASYRVGYFDPDKP